MISPQNVQVLYDAETNARLQFGLNTKADLIAFIGNGGLQDMSYVNSVPWKNNPKRDIKEIFIDSYKFQSNRKVGYIAFSIGSFNNYVIKSFHLDHDKITLGQAGNNPINTLR